MLQVNDMLQSFQEPHINLGQLLDALHAVSLFQCLCNGKDTKVGRILQGIVKVVEMNMVITHESVHALTNHTQSFLNHLLEGTTDRHDLAHGFHRRTNQTRNASEFREVPARNLTDHIVKTRSYVS